MTETYSVGDRVRVNIFGGEKIDATIAAYEEDIKNDRPGYLLCDCSDGQPHWCYTNQVAGFSKVKKV